MLFMISMEPESLRNVNKLNPVLLKHMDILELRKAEVYFFFFFLDAWSDELWFSGKLGIHTLWEV